ncbi:MAG: histone deacetylase [Desulfarculaceae bacterium]|jgi:acetoin utilization deacetylase AcuC-like enzyme
MAIGLVRDPIFQEHDAGAFHPESPQRLVAIDQALKSWPGNGQIQTLPLRPATEEELIRVHQSSHVQRVASCKGRRVALDPDTTASPRSYEVALLAAGSLISLCDAALEGKVKNGAALVRPPGHHATANRAMGFCLFNNIAAATSHLLEARDLERVLIVDWDVHHGNGTEDIFFEDPRVLFFSTHQWPFYPGSGPVNAIGAGEGQGYNVNIPLPGGMGDGEYVRVFEDLLIPLAKLYKPQFILVSAGFDGHAEDPLGGMLISDQGYGVLAGIVAEIAEEFCPGRVVLTLEGGYNPPAVGRSLVACLESLIGNTQKAWELRQDCQKAQQPHSLLAALDLAMQNWDLG